MTIMIIIVAIIETTVGGMYQQRHQLDLHASGDLQRAREFRDLIDWVEPLVHVLLLHKPTDSQPIGADRELPATA